MFTLDDKVQNVEIVVGASGRWEETGKNILDVRCQRKVPHQQNLILPIESRQTRRLAIDAVVAIDSHRLVIDTTCLCSTW